jgi:polyisoprenoid-binding protein YceI
MRGEVLEAARYPEIASQSTQVSVEQIAGSMYRAKITGNLALHGLARSETIEAQVLALSDGLRASGECKRRQSDCQIAPVSALGGTIKLKDELKLNFEIVAQQEG